MAASLAEQAAEIAATQAVTATTQAVLRSFNRPRHRCPRLARPSRSTGQAWPPVGKGNLIIASPNYIIVQTGGKRFIFVKSSPPNTDDEADYTEPAILCWLAEQSQ